MLKSQQVYLEIGKICSDCFVSTSIAKDALAKALSQTYNAIMQFHQNGAGGKSVCKANSCAMDCIIEFLYTKFVEKRKSRGREMGEKFCIVATGGYGREELSPKSDIDIIFLYENGISSRFKTIVVDEIMYPLWDCGLRIGHSSCTYSEALSDAKTDILLRNSMLDSRIICGNKKIYSKFLSRFNSLCSSKKKEHFEELLRLKRDRHAKFGWTPYLQEPNLKNGIGGLRDAQTMSWKTRLNFGEGNLRQLATRSIISKSEYRAVLKAYDFLLRVRNDMHYFFAREVDLLDLENQPIIAKRLGFISQNDDNDGVEEFMRKIYFSFRTIDSVAKTARKRMGIVLPDDVFATMRHLGKRLPANRKFEIDGFSFYRGEAKALSNYVFQRDPTLLVKVFAMFQEYGVVPSDSLEVLIKDSRILIDDNVRTDSDTNLSFLSILEKRGNVFPTLELMHYWGVLGEFVPEFKDITCMVQHEFYHRYTVDVHTLNTIAQLDKVFCASQNDGVYYEYHKVLLSSPSPILLYPTILLHDIGKGDGIRGHAEVSADLAKGILRRWGVQESDIEPIIFAIKNHLQMARFWQSNDVEDETAIAKFASIVKNEENLKYLYVLTFCDASGTADGFWNSYKQGLHSALFSATMAYFNKRRTPAMLERRKAKVLAESLADTRSKGIENIILEQSEFLPQNYFMLHGRSDLLMHAKMISQLRENLKDNKTSKNPVVEWRDDPNDSISRLYVVSQYQRGMFSVLSGIITLSGLDILGSKVFKRSDGITLDAFYVSGISGGMSANPRIKARFAREIDAVINGDIKLESRVNDVFYSNNKYKENKVISDVFMRRESGKIVIELRASDRVGLLYKVAKIIEENGYDIAFARINTERGWAQDTFHIVAGGKHNSSAVLLKNLRELA